MDNCQDSGGRGKQKRGPPPPIQEERGEKMNGPSYEKDLCEGFLERI